MPALPVADILLALIRYQSISPHDAGCADYIASLLRTHRFTIHRIEHGESVNLFATRGDKGPHYLFAGHMDVVPPGDSALWSHTPFAGICDNGMIVGRGAVDMKGAIAAFIAAIAALPPDDSRHISLLLTSDEELTSEDGMQPMIEWLKTEGHVPDYCLVGEPTSEQRIGDTLKVGRRGSISFRLTLEGKQGHVAYPQHAANPLPAMAACVTSLVGLSLDEGSEGFQPSHLEMTSIDTGNATGNVIPGASTACWNVRFNPSHTADTVDAHCRNALTDAMSHFPTITWHLTSKTSAHPFYCGDSPWARRVQQTVESITGRPASLSTVGGTSDARFLHHLCPVVELGLCNATAHGVNEQVSVADLEMLSRLYLAMLSA